MAKSSNLLEWCIVRLGDDINWWVEEVSDPVRWDVDGLSILDPRQLSHFVDLVEALRDYGFDQDVMDRAFIAFRIDRSIGEGQVRLVRSKESLFDSDEKLFALPDVLDEENGPYADLLDHLTRARVKMLNDLFDFEQKLTIDEVEDEIREDQNAEFMEGKAIHVFDEISAILDYVPAGWETEDEEGVRRTATEEEEEIDAAELPDLDEEDEKALEGDSSLKWDEEEEEDEDAEGGKGDSEDEEDDDAAGEDEEEAEEEDEDDERPRRSGRKGR